MTPKDDRYEMPVNSIPADKLQEHLAAAFKSVEQHFPPHTGIIIFAFDFAPGGMSYMSNSNRADAIAALEEWIAHTRTLT